MTLFCKANVQQCFPHFGNSHENRKGDWQFFETKILLANKCVAIIALQSYSLDAIALAEVSENKLTTYIQV